MTTTDRVRNHLMAAADLRGVTQGTTARHLNMGKSTLNRALRHEGTTYLALLDAERKARTEALLSRNRHADTAAVCRVTGYGPASISRAIQRWFGATLPQCREAL